MRSCRVHITGVVQGVGMRPYVWNLAEQLQLSGWVRNSSSGVDIEVEGASRAVEDFLKQMGEKGPPLARIDRIEVVESTPGSRPGFTILESREEAGAYLPVSADMATCDDCVTEMRDPGDRRHRYPFTNCTNCGPRFTIIEDIPYDRPSTTMKRFPMCEACAAEYHDPGDRRFHAQPVACPECGPRIWLEEAGAEIAAADHALRGARERLAAGSVVAIKGLGGFHLACDAASSEAVGHLRDGKNREQKPFALLAPDVATIEKHADVPPGARAILESRERPIVLLKWRDDSPLARAVAPGRRQLGFMLPYTPLHHLLVEPDSRFPSVLVMTSGNLSDEPIAYENDDARRRLAGVASALLLHDRDIHVRCDDSVVGVVVEKGDLTVRVKAGSPGRPYFFRRSRGFAPLPVPLPFDGPSVLAVGGDLKNAFCMTRDALGFMSHHIGDLGYLETLRSLMAGLEHHRRLFRISPSAVAHDLHPDYESTRFAVRFAEEEGIPVVAVQHHHAHVAACMGDHGIPAGERVIGVAMDGTGYGSDGAIWGGEFLIADYTSYERAMYLDYCPLAGGDASTRRPYRVALSWMRGVGIPWEDGSPSVSAATEEERSVLEQQLEQGINAPPTSSMGRLFDAVASMAGVCQRVTYEGQAACEFEAAYDPHARGSYPFGFRDQTIDPAPMLHALFSDQKRGVPVGALSARFHHGVAHMVTRACLRLRELHGLDRVALSGGVWQNLTLLHRSETLLTEAGFDVLVHRQVPPNDGGLALGQALVASASFRNEDPA